MRLKKKLQAHLACCILLLQLINSPTLWSQTVSFEKVGLKEGLSQVSVLSIHKDHLNRMWFGTRNGLNCWDGETMKSYYPNEQDSLLNTSFAMIKILQIGNELWILSRRKELIKFNLETLLFHSSHYTDISDIAIHQNNLIAITKRELLSYQCQLDSFIQLPIADSTRHDYTKVYNDDNETLWIVDKKQNRLLKKREKKLDQITLPPKTTVNDLMLDTKGRLWIATQYKGIYIYDENDSSFQTINKITSPYHLKSKNVRSLKQDESGKIWAGTFNGVSMFDFTQKKCTHYVSSIYPHLGLSNNSVHSLYISDDDFIWAGTYYGGVSYGKTSNPVYNSYSTSNPESISPNAIIGDMAEDDNGNLWIGTEGDGLYYYNIATKGFSSFKQTNKNNGPSQTNIKALHLTKKHLLIGTYRGGLNVMNLKTREYKHYENEIKNLISIVPYRGDYLLGTHRGVYRFNLKEERFTQMLSSNDLVPNGDRVIIRDILIDSRDIIWIGTSQNGLIKYNPKTQKIDRFLSSASDPHSISSNAINFLFEDKSSRLWIGTIGGGLNHYHCKNNSFSVYNKKNNNLQDNYICSIIESKLGNIWVATSSGLSILDKKKNTFSNYDSKTGFPIEELNTKALLETKLGNIYVGGIGDLISFEESSLLLAKNHYNIIFSELEVNNKVIRTNDPSQILSSDISSTQAFTLEPKHSSFKIKYSACNYNPLLKNNYQYKLEGFNDSWIDAKFSTYASYTNLNSGTYTFKVRAVDIANNPISEIKEIKIIVKPPLWQRWYAYIIYLLIITILILFFNYIYLDKMSLAYQLKDEKKENERIKELNLYKLRFFTNISHEFMTPLTIMLSTLDDVLEQSKLNDKVKKQLQKVTYNAKRLKNLNRELLDFRRIEQGHLDLKVSKNNIITYIEQCFSAFEDIARIKQINYSFEQNSVNIPLWFDPVQMDKVLYNLLSNAFNHVNSDGGEIQVEVQNRDEELLIEVTNSGKGIPEDEISKIFNRFFQSAPNKEHNEYYGSGIGLALSQSIIRAHKGKIYCKSIENHFTTFSVLLKKGKEHFDPKTLSQNSSYSSFTFEKDLIFDPTSPKTNNEINELSPSDAPTLLIVDDNSEIRAILNKVFSKKFHIIVAENGEDGIKQAIDKQPDIIISDIKMPVMSGLEMCRKLKRNISTNHIPIALLSALSSDTDKTEGFKSGADAFISKPFKTETLLARIESLLKNKKLVNSKYTTKTQSHSNGLAYNKSDKIFIENALLVIEKNKSNSEFSMSDFAKEMNMSRTLFFERVKTTTGLTPNEFIQSTRLKKAAEILNSDSNTNVSQVAYSLGFSSPQYFSRCFKNHFGVSPSRYGKQQTSSTIENQKAEEIVSKIKD